MKFPELYIEHYRSKYMSGNRLSHFVCTGEVILDHLRVGQGSAGVAEKTEVPAPRAGVVSLLAVGSVKTSRIG